MALIEVRELRRLADGRFEVGIRFGGAEEYSAVVGDPFAPEEEALLAWYFEEHLKLPFVRGVDAQKAAASVPRYGEALFGQLFADREAYLAYGREADKGIDALAWAVAGSEDFHRLHWEALKDPRLPRAFALEGPMVRQNLKPRPLAAVDRAWPALHLLIVTARPFGPNDVGARTISRPLVETLRGSGARVEVEILRPGTYKALENHLQEVRDREGAGYYHAVHFDLHGGLLSHEALQEHVEGGRILYGARYARPDLPAYAGQKAFLFLEGDHDGQPADPVEAGEVAALLTGHQIPVAILNACQSGKPLAGSDAQEGTLGSRLMEAGLQVVLAMGYSVTVTAAKVLMESLYRQLFEGKDLTAAIRRGRLELHHQRTRKVYFNQAIELEDWILPVVYQNREVRFAVRDFTPEEARAWYEEKHGRFREPETAYGFFGRDLDVLAVERKLLEHNLLLVQGMGGAGKTTLLKHLGAWWQETGWVEQVFYFGWDEKAWNLQQIGDAIAGRLLPEARFHSEYRPLGPGVQAAWLAERLKGGRHLLILDNLESITGSPLSIRNTLPPEEQERLRLFLADLKGGKTRVLLGSRGGEEWLAPGIFVKSVHELQGLDEEAASALADQVLERAGARKYREDETLKRLLRLLSGYPLAIQVVLQNLARQSPQEILEALQAGDVVLDDPKAKDKTESILRCIDYSYCHLSPEAQGLLACLAPFTGVMAKMFLPQYTEHLKQEPALAHLPFERWEETLQEAGGWGLLTPHEVPGYLTVQPTLPYFLRSRLKAAERAEECQAIERAFWGHYQELCEALANLLDSQEPQEGQAGATLVGIEYENLNTALDLALMEQVSIEEIYKTLALYIEATQDPRRGLELSQRILARMETYPPEKLEGQLGWELGAVLDGVAKGYFLTQQYPQSEVAYQKALHVFQDLKGLPSDRKSSSCAGIYHQLGYAAFKQHQWEKAETCYQQALQILIELQDPRQANTYQNLGNLALELRQWKKAEDYYQKSLQIQIEFNDRRSQASTYHNLGYVAQMQRLWEKAETCFKHALEIQNEFNDRYSQASTYNNLGNIAYLQRLWEKAELYFQKTLGILIEFNHRYDQAVIYQNLGSVALERSQWEQAEIYYRQALQIQIEFNDRYAEAKTYHGLGHIAQKQSRWEEAEILYQQALQILIEFGDRYSQASTYHNLGSSAQEQGRWEAAEANYLKALDIYRESNERYEQADTLNNLGVIAQEQSQWERAREYFLKALQIYAEDENFHHGSLTFVNLSSLWRQSGDATLPEAVGRLLSTAPEEVEERFREILAGGSLEPVPG